MVASKAIEKKHYLMDRSSQSKNELENCLNHMISLVYSSIFFSLLKVHNNKSIKAITINHVRSENNY